MKKIIAVLWTLGITGLYALKGSQTEISKETVQNWLQQYIGFEKNIGQI